jgi:hypothetical protein
MKLKANLFPHTYLPGMMIEKIISIFGPVRIYQPWFMDSKDSFNGTGLETLSPPDNLRPGADVKAMLTGYRQWIDQNRDKVSREFLRVSEKARQGDGSTWEIRHQLKAGAGSSVAGNKEATLKWHMLLHLADDIERRKFEIAEMVNAMKKKSPVLAGALQDPDETEALLDDMRGLESIDIQVSPDIGLILNAWFSIFGGYLDKNAALITCSRHVMDYISSRWNDEFTNENEVSPQSVSFKLPTGPWSDLPLDNKIEADMQVNVMKMRELLSGLGEDPARTINGLKTLAGELGEPEKTSVEASAISLKYFPTREMITESGSVLKHIMGKMIIHFSPEEKIGNR